MTSATAASLSVPSQRHPKGLAPLFFTEMWERLGFYMIVGILVLYVTDTERGGLGVTLRLATEIYGTYMAFVYFTPFLGGMIADRYLGYRRAVLIGGLFLAAGYFLIGVRSMTTLYAGLVLVCIGNGLFKPNISAMVGNLYAPGDPKRDTGFNIFYMGINIGASLSALLSAPLRNEWDFNVAFIGAGVGLLIGVGNLLYNWKALEAADRPPQVDPRDVGMSTIVLTILLPAGVFGIGGFFVGRYVPQIDSTIGPITFGFLVGMAPVMFYFLSLVFRADAEEKPGLAALIPVYIAGGAFFMILHLSGGLMTIFAEHRSSREAEWMPEAVRAYYSQNAMPSYFRNADAQLPRPPEEMLVVAPAELEAMFGARRVSEDAVHQIQSRFPGVTAVDQESVPGEASERWDFLALRVYASDQVSIRTARDEHGAARVTVDVPETATALRSVLLLREGPAGPRPVILVTQDTYDLVYKNASSARLEKGRFINLLNAELITGFLNPFFVVLLTPVVVAFFSWRIRSGKPVSTARKILYGMLITFASLLIMSGGAYAGGDGASKVSLWWLVVYYVVVTVGELCLSPMGLSLVTKLSPKRLVGLMMGGWFVATSVGNKLSGFISQLEPTGRMFIILALAPLAVAFLILMVLPMLDRAIRKYGA
ncbi:MAG: MFS transporter [Planctomycetes bacterium]|nr:MFS transporter [Planctomycetota bacterium]